MTAHIAGARDESQAESGYAWLRLALAVLISTIGGVGMWSVVVALPAVQAEFGVARADASLPYTLTMIGFALGGVVMGRLADRFGIVRARHDRRRSRSASATSPPASPTTSVAVRAGARAADRRSAARRRSAPLMADISHWFDAAARHRGRDLRLAAIISPATIWPPVVQHFIATSAGARRMSASACSASSTMLPLALPAAPRRRRAHRRTAGAALRAPRRHARPLARTRCRCCCASPASPAASRCRCRRCTSSPIAATSATASARGAEMLSLMLGFGIVSRIGSGFIADRIGGLRDAAARLGAAGRRRCCSICCFDGLTSLYVISALFGLFQGGIVPMLRDHRARIFPAAARPARASAS